MTHLALAHAATHSLTWVSWAVAAAILLAFLILGRVIQSSLPGARRRQGPRFR